MTNPVQLEWARKIIALLISRLGGDTGLIDDPDHLLSGDVIRLLGESGWRIIPVYNSLELRHAYEQNTRSFLQAHPSKSLYILFFPISNVPFDIVRDSIYVLIKLKDFFPALSEKVLKQLPLSWLAVIDHNLTTLPSSGKTMNEQQTAAIILESCLGLNFPTTSSLAGALGLLADLVLHNLELPPVLVNYIMDRISVAWPGDYADLISAPARARNFLQQVWQTYLESLVDNRPALAEGGNETIAVATDILARDRSLQSQISALLAENIIQPPTIQAYGPLPDWIRPGVHFHLDRQSFLSKRLSIIKDNIPGENATPDDWTELAWLWADWRQDLFQDSRYKSDLRNRMVETQLNIETSFIDWLQRRYTDLLSQPYLPAPAMVQHALHYIAARFLPSEKRPLAIVVVDGMAIEDWLVLRKSWIDRDLNWCIQEHSLFALVPSITPVSRQALLSGKLPRNFVGDWLSTSTEEAAWRVFWEEHGLHPESIAYQRGLGSFCGENLRFDEATERILNQPHKAVTVLVVNTIDNLVHNDILGSDAFLQQIATWGKQGYLGVLISRLLEQHETVIITADHGHVEGHGIGDIALKEATVERSLRTRIFSDRAFEMVHWDPKVILQWSNAGLPDNARVFIPSGLGLFAKPGTTAISHGGAALEEVIIPFITISRMLS